MIEGCSTFIHVGQIHIDRAPSAISTVLGSCVAVCLYDERLQLESMNHYLLPFWNGNGLQTPRFGNISIPKMIESMIAHGSSPRYMQAKVFGGASLSAGVSEAMMIGEKNILVAKEMLAEYKIAIVAEDTGGNSGRKIQMDLERGKVLLKYASSQQGWL